MPKRRLIIAGVNIFEIDLASAREEFHKLGRPGKNLYNFGTILFFFTKNKKKIRKFNSMWPKSDEFCIY